MRPVTAPRVALVSTAAYAHLDDDLPPLLAALGRAGVDATVVDWHDPDAAWDRFDLAVLRSTWDYTEHLERFLEVLGRVDAATELANPLEVVRANADKRYLLALAAAGVPVVPTTVVEPGMPVELPGATPFVVKPAVSAGARDTERYRPGDDAATDHARRLLAEGRAVLVQPYVAGIDEAGETGVVYAGDRVSHAFRKGPILRPGTGFVEGLYREEEISPRSPSGAELTVAEAALDAVAGLVPGRTRADLLYARVDLAPGPDGPLVMELELIEPSLFLAMDPTAPDRLAAAIVARTGA